MAISKYEFAVTFTFSAEIEPDKLQEWIKTLADDPETAVLNAENVMIYVDGEKEYDSKEDDHG